MVEVGIAEAQSTLAALIEQVRSGEEVVITNESGAVARLVPMQAKPPIWTEAQIARAQAASERIREIAMSLPRQHFDWEEVKKDLGRKY